MSLAVSVTGLVISCKRFATKPIVINYLKPEFSISKEETEKIIKDNESKAKVSVLLKTFGFKQSVFKKHPWILVQPINVLEKKLDLIKHLSLNINNIDILKLELEELRNFSKNAEDRVSNFEERVNYFQKELDLPYEETLNIVKRYKFLRTRALNKLVEIMELLKAAGVDNEAIHEDMWIFSHNIHLMKARLVKVKEYKCPIRTWMLRCSEKILSNSLRRWTNRIEVLGEAPDLVDYLAKRLECDRKTVTLLTNRNVRLLTINPPKIKKVLDYVFEHGFTPSHVRQTPRILNCSFKTIEKRMMDFKKLEYSPSSLAVFYNSKENHNRLIKKIQMKEE